MRITPSLRSQKGQIWSKHPTSFDWWEVEVHFRYDEQKRDRVRFPDFEKKYLFAELLEEVVSAPMV